LFLSENNDLPSSRYANTDFEGYANMLRLNKELGASTRIQ